MPTKIEWCDDTLNIVTGCMPDFPCWQRCYARRMANRLRGRFGYDADEPFKPTFHPDKLDQPLHWSKPRRIFVVSMGDLFCEGVPHEWVERVMQAIGMAPQHTYMILTKRPRRMGDWFKSHKVYASKNLWLGISVSTQAELWERWEWLRQIPAAVRFVSLEPLLEDVDLQYIFTHTNSKGRPFVRKIEADGRFFLDWVIVGPETGPKARPMDLDWARNIRDQCRGVGTPFFFKPGPLDGVMWQEFPK